MFIRANKLKNNNKKKRFGKKANGNLLKMLKFDSEFKKSKFRKLYTLYTHEFFIFHEYFLFNKENRYMSFFLTIMNLR